MPFLAAAESVHRASRSEYPSRVRADPFFVAMTPQGISTPCLGEGGVFLEVSDLSRPPECWCRRYRRREWRLGFKHPTWSQMAAPTRPASSGSL